VRIVTPPGVFAPISDSRMLSRALVEEDLLPGARVLDLCTGSGIMAVTAAMQGAHATAVDVSRRAVLTARLNARLNGVRVRALRGSLFDPVRAERFDCIVSNPPYVPCEEDTLPSRGLRRAWDAGRDGRILLDQICREAAEQLRPGGRVLLTHSTLIGEERTLALLEESGLEAETIVRRQGPLGPLMAERVKQGVLPADTDTEEVLIIRGRRPLPVRHATLQRSAVPSARTPC
jgi:release factor glutamine methyltransferase